MLKDSAEFIRHDSGELEDNISFSMQFIFFIEVKNSDSNFLDLVFYELLQYDL